MATPATPSGTISVAIPNADGSVTNLTASLANCVVTTTPPPTVTSVQASANPATVEAGAQAQLSATVHGTGSFSSGVTWTASAGTISATGVFTAPAAGGPVTITATSTEDPTKSSSVTVVVQAPPTPPPPLAVPPVIPATAKTVNALPMPGWKMNHDAGTSGSSVGTTSYPVTAPDGTPNCRLFDFTNTAGGGEIYHFAIVPDCTPFKNFCFKFRRTAAPGVTNSEHDLEAVDASGNPLDMATQEDGYKGVFDVTESHKWVGTGIKVDPTTWVPGSWHDDEIYLTANGDGTVTYVGVTIDGVYHPLRITVADVDGSKWTPKILNLQIQFDTKSTAAVESKVYCSQCEVDCW